MKKNRKNKKQKFSLDKLMIMLFYLVQIICHIIKMFMD